MAQEATLLSDEELEKFAGEWVVICDDQVIAHSRNLTKLESDINKCRKTPTILKIPKEDTLIF